uniref:Choline/carnitine acyltransferase domain-containing protein n=1 Tax=Piliocolobus tephrosceles TaxID=591936 RepID=A0A8C9GFW7_9PRIM
MPWRSIFTVCLDAPMPRVSEDVYRSHVAGQMLHGGGSRLNSGNRWFDKTLQNKHISLGWPPPWSQNGPRL